MCDIIHQRHYKFWLRFDSIFKLTSFFEKQKQLLGIIHGLTNKVIMTGLVDFLYRYAIILALPDSRRIPSPMQRQEYLKRVVDFIRDTSQQL